MLEKNIIEIKVHDYNAMPFEQHGNAIDLRMTSLKEHTKEVRYFKHKQFGIPIEIEVPIGYVKELEDGAIYYTKGSIFKINLGISMKLPAGVKADIKPRSGTRKNFGVILTNSVGLIDNNYSGTNDVWMAEFYALQDGVMNPGDRVLQFEILDTMNEYEFEEVEELNDVDRGGYSSTGV
jgi:dUTP pyrophosphatase